MTTQICRCWLLVATLVLAFPLAANAAERKDGETPAEDYQPTDAVATELQKVNQYIGAENWEAALLAVNAVLKKTQPGTYDRAISQLHVAQIHLSRNKKDLGDYAAAIPALTEVVKSGFWPKDKILEWKYILAQLCAQEDKLAEAEQYIREWLNETPAPTPDAYVFYVTLIVQRAQKDAENVDKKLLETALAEAHKGLLLGAKPNETLLYLQAACYQGLERWDDAAETLELLLKMNPRNKTYWNQLLGMYVTAGSDLRAALTIERANKYDTMNTPRENIALAQLYHNMKQFDRSIEILEKGLNDGTIEPIKTHWEMLGHAYQSMNQDFKAINTFIRADKHVDDGYFLALVGNAYYAMGKNADALKYLNMAVKKGVENPGQVSLFGAYLAFELKEYTIASDLLKVAKDHLVDDRQRNDYRGLREVVDQAIAQETQPKDEAAAPAARR